MRQGKEKFYCLNNGLHDLRQLAHPALDLSVLTYDTGMTMCLSQQDTGNYISSQFENLNEIMHVL